MGNQILKFLSATDKNYSHLPVGEWLFATLVYVCCIKLRVGISCDVTDTALYVACRGRRSTSQSRVTTGALAPAPGLGLRTPGYRGNWESPKPTRSWWWMTWGQGSCYRQTDRSDQVNTPPPRRKASHPAELCVCTQSFVKGVIPNSAAKCMYMCTEKIVPCENHRKIFTLLEHSVVNVKYILKVSCKFHVKCFHVDSHERYHVQFMWSKFRVDLSQFCCDFVWQVVMWWWQPC